MYGAEEWNGLHVLTKERCGIHYPVCNIYILLSTVRYTAHLVKKLVGHHHFHHSREVMQEFLFLYSNFHI